jgi:hypothetical protein
LLLLDSLMSAPIDDVEARIQSVAQRAGVKGRIRYFSKGNISIVRCMYAGAVFIDAPWSIHSRHSFANLTQIVATLDPQGKLELVVFGIDETPIGEIPEFQSLGGGYWESIFVNKGKIIEKARILELDLRQFIRPLVQLSHPPVIPDSWPLPVTDLAVSLSAGEDCAFALHDALLEGGHAELAQHFREEQWHPKGCWALDLILGKK